MLETDVFYHFASALGRRKNIEPCFFSVENAESGRTVHLVSGAYIEVAVQVFDVHGKMRGGLCAVYADRYVVFVRYADDLLYGLYRP